MKQVLCILVAASLLLGVSARAANISWGVATNISGDSDVSTTGSSVGAFNLGDGGVGSTTVNGVLFAAFGVNVFDASVTVGSFTLTGDTVLDSTAFTDSASTPFSGLSASYQSLLGSAAGNRYPAFASTLTMNGLTIGKTYQFQWWSNVSSAGFGGPAAMTYSNTASAGNSVTLDWNTTDIEGGLGQYAIGTFVADATSQAVSFVSADELSIVNAFQLRDISQVSGQGPAAAPLPLAVWVGLSLGGLVVGRAVRNRP